MKVVSSTPSTSKLPNLQLLSCVNKIKWKSCLIRVSVKCIKCKDHPVGRNSQLGNVVPLGLGVELHTPIGPQPGDCNNVVHEGYLVLKQYVLAVYDINEKLILIALLGWMARLSGMPRGSFVHTLISQAIMPLSLSEDTNKRK